MSSLPLVLACSASASGVCWLKGTALVAVLTAAHKNSWPQAELMIRQSDNWGKRYEATISLDELHLRMAGVRISS